MRYDQRDGHLRAVGASALALAFFACATVNSYGTADCADPIEGFLCPSAAGASGLGGASGASGASGGGSGGEPMGGAAGAGMGGGGAGGSGGIVCMTPAIECGGACVDVKAENAAHCGACGRSCLGAATCAAGACVPEAMATGEVAPYALVHDEASLYWVSPAVKTDVGFRSRVRRVAKAGAGGAAESLFGSTEVRARSLGFDGAKLYWGDLEANGIFSGTPGVAFPDASPFAADQLDVRHLAVAAGKAFWSVGGEGAVRGKPFAGGALAPELFSQPNPTWVAADETGAPHWVAGVTSEVRRTKAVAPGYEAFATGAGIVAVELAGDAVYWADAAAGVVRSAPKTATPPAAGVVAFEGRGRVEGFRLEDTTLYVVTLQDGALAVWRKAEGDAEPFLLGRVSAKATGYAGNPFGAAYVLTDAQYLYFADVGTVDTSPDVDTSAADGVVYRVAK